MSENKYRDLGLLILRVGIGLLIAYHGTPKIAGGVEGWTKLGLMSMPKLGITFAPAFWGFMAAMAEFCGGIAFALGLFTRMFSALMLVTMIVAVVFKLSTGGGLMGASEAVALGTLFLSMMLIGPGKYSVDAKFFERMQGSCIGRMLVVSGK